MRISWGTNIALVYLLFMAAMVAVVIISLGHNVNLVAEDYYAREIKYQQQYEKEKRTLALPQQLEITAGPKSIRFSFPDIFPHHLIKGKIHFYRPSDDSKDFFAGVKLDSTNVQTVSTRQMEKGLWKVKVDWSVNSVNYYNEKIIMVN